MSSILTQYTFSFLWFALAIYALFFEKDSDDIKRYIVGYAALIISAVHSTTATLLNNLGG
jgi:hypothetical protein